MTRSERTWRNGSISISLRLTRTIKARYVWLLPNPLYRTIEKSHLEQPRSGFAESVAFKDRRS